MNEARYDIFPTPNGGPYAYQFRPRNGRAFEQIIEVVEWCDEQFGMARIWGMPWCCIGSRIYFKNEAEALLFRLRWC